ncbi:MAG: helix-turn-helix transcriptional regulator [Eubacteriales bacterium]|nr:helix-turn-helix transcriptional regulator [Eubacteriales bacterium]MDD4390816.1 helix-turn-helix transcriptional regulator [Eubacteriales bacterium]
MDILQNNLQLIRVEKRRSQTQVARALNIARSTYAMYEAGKRLPDIGILYSLSTYFNVPMEYLYCEDTRRCVEELKLYLKMSSDEKKLLDMYKFLSNYARGRLMERAESLMDEQQSMTSESRTTCLNFAEVPYSGVGEYDKIIRIY